jgi:hypothetical protein
MHKLENMLGYIRNQNLSNFDVNIFSISFMLLVII